ncbi:hypothetical protein NFI96_031914, partial [Prochilodus magdalenae]
EDPKKSTVKVQPARHVFIGETVTLTCDIEGGGGWQYQWSKDDNPLSDAREKKEYRISKAGQSHRGDYTCNGIQSTEPSYSQTSDAVTLTVSDVSPRVSLMVSPSRTQHFTTDSLSLSCKGEINSTGWRVRRYTHSEKVSDCSSDWGSVRGPTCNISSLSTSHTGVYWCESESGGSSIPVNITVPNGSVILESPVHPVPEGDPLTLRCLYHYTKPSNLTAEFYKDGSLIQTQTTGEMTIRAVSKSDEGLYHCKHPERGESSQSWISVRGSESNGLIIIGVAAALSVTLFLIVILSLIYFYKKKKGNQKNTNQTSGQNQNTGSSLLQPANDHVYDSVGMVDNTNTDHPAAGSSDVTYAQVMSTKKKPGRDDNSAAGSNDITYAQVSSPKKKPGRDDDSAAGSSDATYAQVMSTKRKPRGNGDAVTRPNDVTYSQIPMKNLKSHSEAEPSDVTYAEINQKVKKPKKAQVKARLNDDAESLAAKMFSDRCLILGGTSTNVTSMGPGLYTYDCFMTSFLTGIISALYMINVLSAAGLGVLAEENPEHRAAGSSIILPLGHPKDPDLYALWKYKEKTFAIYFNGQLRITEAQQFSGRLKLDSDSLSVEVTDLQIQDSGSYSIVAEKSGAQLPTKIINLTVYDSTRRIMCACPPKIKIESNQTWVESTDSCIVHLVCRAPEDQSVSYTWSGYKTESGAELHFTLSPADGDVTLNCTAVGRLGTGTNTTRVKCNPNKTLAGSSFSVLRLLSSLMALSPYLLVSIVLGVKCYRARGLGVLADGNTVTERRAAGSSLILPLGHPKESVVFAEWKYEGRTFALYNEGQLHIINELQFSGRLKRDSDSLSVEVTDLQLPDSGSYSITVYKHGAQPPTKMISLTVYAPLKIKIESNQTWVESTDSCEVHLLCRAGEDQSVSYTWSGYKTESGAELHFTLSPADGDVTLNCTAVGRFGNGTNTTRVKCNPNKTPPGTPFSVLSLLSSLMAVSPYLLVSIVLGVKCYRARAKPEEENSVHAVIEERAC